MNEVRSDTGIAQLIRLASDAKQERAIRVAAIRSLGHTRSVLAIGFLLELSQDNSIDCEYRVAAINSIGKATGSLRANCFERDNG